MVLANTFDRHDFGYKWSYAEFDAARNMLSWSLGQILDSVPGIASLADTGATGFFGNAERKPIDRLTVSNNPAQDLPGVRTGSLRLICVDPPYYDNVNYASCSDFFFVWMKRTIGSHHKQLFANLYLTPKDEEAVADPARFAVAAAKRRKELAAADYENKMAAGFAECTASFPMTVYLRLCSRISRSKRGIRSGLH